MKDEKESHDDAHWRALAESLKGDDEPPRQAEVIRAQFRRKPAVEKDARTPDKGIQTSGQARQPATKRPGDETQPVDGRPVDGQPVDTMSRPELIAYLRSALATLEQNPAAPNSAEPDPAQADQLRSAVKQIPPGDPAAFPVSKAPNEIPSAVATGESPAPSDMPGGKEESAAQADGIVARSARLLHADELPSLSDTPSGNAEPMPAPDKPAEDRDPSDRGDGSISPIPTPKQRLQFSQEVPDFLRSRDISWPGATDPARKGAVVPNRMAARPGRLETLYPGQIPDPREAPPPWVKNQNAQTRSKRRSRLVSISVAAAVILMLSLGTTWVLTQSEASARILVAESIRSWLNRAGSATATGVRQTGSVIQALLPFGDDRPAIQSIVLLPQSGQQPSVQIPTPDPSPTVSAAQIEADPRAATELPPIASQTAPTEADPPEAFALTITPTSNAVAGSQPAYDTPEAITRPTETLDIVAADKSAGLTELAPAPAGTQEGPLPEQIDTEIVVQRDLVLSPSLPDQRRAVGQTRAAVIDTPVAPPPAVLQPGTEVPVAEISRNPPSVVVSSNLPAPPLESWRVQLASLADVERAQAEWQRLQQIHPALLASQPLHIERVELDRGAFHRIQVGNFDSVAAAQDLCDGLKARGQDCLVVR